MAIRKNTRRFDPRYFMDEKTDPVEPQLKEYFSMSQQDPSSAADALADIATGISHHTTHTQMNKELQQDLEQYTRDLESILDMLRSMR
jgi:membrane carboxypeptidase/penicillin-binding protein PbpC